MRENHIVLIQLYIEVMSAIFTRTYMVAIQLNMHSMHTLNSWTQCTMTYTPSLAVQWSTAQPHHMSIQKMYW